MKKPVNTEVVAKQSPAKQKESADKSAIAIRVSSEVEVDLATARTLTRPEIGAAAIMEKWQPDTYDVNVLAEELAAQVKAVNQGGMQRTEGILISQAQALDAIFVNLMRRSVNQTNAAHWEMYMRMGMKAQSQCRATLQALAEMKNPRPVQFVKQANIAHGPQQVNNGAAAGADPEQYAQARTHAEKSTLEQNKLLEADHGQLGQRMDARAAQAAERSYQAVETVEQVHRAKKPRG